MGPILALVRSPRVDHPPPAFDGEGGGRRDADVGVGDEHLPVVVEKGGPGRPPGGVDRAVGRRAGPTAAVRHVGVRRGGDELGGRRADCDDLVPAGSMSFSTDSALPGTYVPLAAVLPPMKALDSEVFAENEEVSPKIHRSRSLGSATLIPASRWRMVPVDDLLAGADLTQVGDPRRATGERRWRDGPARRGGRTRADGVGRPDDEGVGGVIGQSVNGAFRRGRRARFEAGVGGDRVGGDGVAA